MMRNIIGVHFPNLESKLMEHAVTAFYHLRELDGVEKKPATRELINWIRALNADPDFRPQKLAKGEIPYLGVLFKKSQDLRKTTEYIRRRRLY